MKISPKNPHSRRKFIQGATLSGLAISSGLASQAAISETVDPAKPTEQTGYHESEHIKRYYRLARF